MPLLNPFATFDYTHPNWPKDSSITFRAEKLKGDTDQISNDVADTIVKTDGEAIRQAQRAGRDYYPEVEVKRRKNAQVAIIARMGKGWQGEEFRLPDNFPTPDGSVDPHAGAIAPFEEYYIGLLHEDVLNDIEKHLNRRYALRTPEEQAEFRDGDLVPSESEGD